MALFAALVVEAIKEARIEGIWYGARELGRNRAAAPVIRLDGLIAISRWIRGLAAFDASGDLRSLADLLAPGDRAGAERIDRAAYRERILRLDGIEMQIRDVLRTVGERPDPVIGLFQPHLRRRLSWVRGPTLAARQHRLARIYLDAGDYVRAAILGLEAVVSQEMAKDGRYSEQDLVDDDKRSSFQSRLGKASSEWRTRAARRGDAEVVAWVTAFHDLKEIRNAFAHASAEQDAAIRAAMADEAHMRGFLVSLFETLFDDVPE
ncbi:MULTISPECIES: TM1812 family CRISPR-associated protein [unclassified Bradyrhizobium]|uniref:TM1812 family CRISPR-associated protein n=1 Tax=unclassified Bradyrhizobium TaxID=2631580 RepID=UPI0028E4FB00|nr:MULTISPECIES: TM1812 family CRISPR-associated protein [unclassified Bradyrhizobium]